MVLAGCNAKLVIGSAVAKADELDADWRIARRRFEDPYDVMVAVCWREAGGRASAARKLHPIAVDL